ncbi:MAG: PKD-like family lipoprotein [Candidatus Pseudobacter hemicellulosilyticus]|uniref:PKD-like family lipoprotein n=1 Tax=Candidatus Pseudobacter hemicellulosilyticus TaxID=3121375 RepID=A0AAJ6BHV6_9BACT|nr:MAG: PKD-like family lipoprotein [Pseudobacter sp.]
MKFHLQHILLAGGLLILAAACKKDKGNYSYHDYFAPVVDTAGIGGPRYIEPKSYLVIEPPVSYASGDTGVLRYQWIFYPYITGSGSNNIPVRTIGSSRQLNALIEDKVGEYRAELIVTDTSNQMKVNMIFPVVVSAGIEYGFVVLHSKDDGSDVDFITTGNNAPIAGIVPRHIRNMYSEVAGGKFTKDARFIVQDRRTGANQNWLLIGGAAHLSRMSGRDFSLMRQDAAFFRRPNEVIDPQAQILMTNGYNALINHGKLQMYSTTYDEDALFGEPNDGDYELAPYLSFNTTYALFAAVYDEKYGKFIRPSVLYGPMGDFKPPSVNPATPQAFDLRNIGKTMLYMDAAFNGHTHAFFKDRSGDGRWLYVVNFNKADDSAMAVMKKDMSALPEIGNALFFQASEQGYIDLYATDRKIYAYDYQGTNTASVVYDGLPAGETITKMKIYKPRPADNLSAVTGRLLYVATWNGTEGKLYEFSLNPLSGQVGTTPLNTYTGFGKIVDMNAKARGAGTY